MPSKSNAFAFLEPPSRELPDRRHSTDHSRTTPSNMSRNNSTTSIGSRKSEPGWMSSANNVDRNRAGSLPEGPTTKSTTGFSKLFGKKKEKKDMEQIVITSRHTAAVKTKLALAPQNKNVGVRRDSAPTYVSSMHQNSLLISANAQEMRHPHSGPPAIYTLAEKAELPLLTRIASGDEADEPDELEKMREHWRQRQMPTLENELIEGVEVNGSGEKENEVEVPPSEVVERQGVRMLSAVGMTGDDYESHPPRPHTPIGGRFKKDDKGIWKR